MYLIRFDNNWSERLSLRSSLFALGEMSYHSLHSAQSVLSVIELAKKYYSEGVAVPTSAGTGPMFALFMML